MVGVVDRALLLAQLFGELTGDAPRARARLNATRATLCGLRDSHARSIAERMSEGSMVSSSPSIVNHLRLGRHHLAGLHGSLQQLRHLERALDQGDAGGVVERGVDARGTSCPTEASTTPVSPSEGEHRLDVLAGTTATARR